MLKTWAERTTCHGIADLARSKKNAVRAAWTGLIVLSICTVTVEIVGLCNTFWGRRWQTSVYEEIPNGEILYVFRCGVARGVARILFRGGVRPQVTETAKGGGGVWVGDVPPRC